MPRPQKRSVTISGHRTSFTLEDEFWQALRQIADLNGKSGAELVQEIDASRGANNLSSAIRLFVLRYYQSVPKN
jgi:predicted DNA-binding ribbon-helix-helix protein